MKDAAWAREIESILARSKEQTARFNARLDLKLQDCSREEGFANFLFDVEEWCRNPYGGVHGGAISSVFDTGMGTGAVALSQHMVSTTELSISYLRPMNGSQYLFQCEYTQVGRRLIRSMGKAFDTETGQLCATAMGSFMVSEAMPKGLRD